MARFDEWGTSAGLATMGGLCYAGGKTLAKEITKGALQESVQYRALNMKAPIFGKIVKNYPNVLKGAGIAGLTLGAAGLAWCIFDEISKKD